MPVPTTIADLTTSEATNYPADSETITATTRPSDYIRAHAAIIKTHAEATAEHGATGAVVGTTNTQTLTNKTLTAPVINGVVTTTGLTMPAMTAGAINGTTIPTSKTLVATDTAASETSAGVVELATQAEAEAGASDAVVMTALKTKQAIDTYTPGLGQTWQDLTAVPRALATTYINSYKKEIKVSVFQTSAAGGNNYFRGLVDGVVVAIGSVSVAAGSAIGLFFTVPPGSSYSVTVSGTSTIGSWFEEF